VADLGIEPGPGMQGRQRAILRQDASLDPPPRAGPSAAPALAEGSGASLASHTRRRRLLAGTATVLAVTLALIITGALTGSARPTPTAAGPNTVAVVDGSRGVMGGIVAGAGRPNGIAYGDGAAWITDSAGDLLLRVDSARRVTDRIPVGRSPAGVAVGDDEIWVANELDGTVSEINPRAERWWRRSRSATARRRSGSGSGRSGSPI
jgi:DNA-binding beta-propeller fold protein YncE